MHALDRRTDGQNLDSNTVRMLRSRTVKIIVKNQIHDAAWERDLAAVAYLRALVWSPGHHRLTHKIK